jgi:hypothetical protein
MTTSALSLFDFKFLSRKTSKRKNKEAWIFRLPKGSDKSCLGCNKADNNSLSCGGNEKGVVFQISLRICGRLNVSAAALPRNPAKI